MNKTALSASNARVTEAARLLLKKHRRETGLVLIEGARLVADALAVGVRAKEIFATSAFAESAAGKRLLSDTDDFLLASEQAAKKLSDTQHPQGVFAVVEFAPRTLDDKALWVGEPSLALVADGIADPGNLGTIVRSAAAFAPDTVVVLTGDSCEAGNPKLIRASMGAVFRIRIAEAESAQDAVAKLKQKGMRTFAAVSRGGLSPAKLDFAGRCALLIGSEAEGLADDVAAAADAKVTIPMPGGTESLNAAVAASVLLYEVSRQRSSRP